MFLEQYHLLTGGFELNTQKTVIFKLNQRSPVYIYDKDKKVLYFQGPSLHATHTRLSINEDILKKHINKGTFFLDAFFITDYLIPGAQKAGLTLEELANLIGEKRILFNKALLKPTKMIPVRLQSVITKNEIDFDSIADAARHLEKEGHKPHNGTLKRYLDTNKVYKDHYCTTIQPA